MIVEKSLMQLMPRDLSVTLSKFQPKKLDNLNFKVEKDKVVYTATNGEGAAPQNIKLASFLQKHVGLGEDLARRFTELTTAKILETVNFNVRVVSGEELRDRYHGKNYMAGASNGNLRSCMSYADEQRNLDFYVYNDKIFSLAVVEDKRGKVAGRTLLYRASPYLTTVKEAPYLVGGRIYYGSEVVRNILINWQKQHCDAQMDNGNTWDTKKQQWVRKIWYVPLQYWAFNYYPYMDNNLYIIMKPTKKLDIGVLTNKQVRSNYVRAEQGSYSDSDNDYSPRPHPIWTDKVFADGKWRRKDEVTEVGGRFFDKKDVGECSKCSTPELKARMYPLHDSEALICQNHSKEYHLINKRGYRYYPRDMVSTCRSCSRYFVTGKTPKQLCEYCGHTHKICKNNHVFSTLFYKKCTICK